MPQHETSIKLRTTPEQAYELLRRLSEDDEFRAALEADHSSVLSGYGIEISPPEALPQEAKLASKEDIQILLESMGDPDDPFGRVTHAAWRFHLLGTVFSFGALPLLRRDGQA